MTASAYDFGHLVQEDRVHRSLYTDPAIFDLEMRRIFGGTWVYLAHESQVPQPDSFFRTRLGRRPIIVTRDRDGRLHGLYNRCTHRGATICRQTSGTAKQFQCPYHGWTFRNTGALTGVPWPDGYAGSLQDGRFDLARIPRLESYRGFIFGTLNMAAPPLRDHLGPVRQPIDEWLDRHPGAALEVREANRLKFRGNWKLAYDNAADGYHVIFSHRSLLMMENRFAAEDQKGMSFYKQRPDSGPVRVHAYPNGHHFKDKRMAIDRRPGGLWRIEGLHPGMEHYERLLRDRFGADADRYLDLACSEPVNINVFPNLLILGNHIQVLEPLSAVETASVWYGTAVVDPEGSLGEALGPINALRMRTQEQFPTFGEVDDLTNFEEIQAGLAAEEDEWVWMHRGLGLPDRFETDGETVSGPATDEVFMRRAMSHYRDLMSVEPELTVLRGDAS